jgi:hypothetical protein
MTTNAVGLLVAVAGSIGIAVARLARRAVRSQE